MRIYWLVLATLWFLWAWEAGGQEIIVPTPLPEGDTGIAAKYPGDAGIENVVGGASNDQGFRVIFTKEPRSSAGRDDRK